MRMNKRKTLWGRAYAIGYRFISDENDIYSNRTQRFDVIMPTSKNGFADPFPFIYQNKHYIFVEIMDKYTERGSIGVCCIEDGCKVTEIIREEFHMSYPNVFEWNDNIYMIPETYQAEQIRLYKCIEFPYKWQLDSILYQGSKVVDFSFYINQNNLYGIAYDIGTETWSNRYFVCDLCYQEMKEIFPEKINVIDKRPGGNFILKGIDKYIPLQECQRCYGEYLHFVKVNQFNEDIFEQEKKFEIKASDIKLKKRFLRYDRVHTYNRVDNFETIDVFLYQFSLKKIWLVLSGKWN